MVEIKKNATRESYGRAFADLGTEHRNMVVLDAYLAGVTKTTIFRKAFAEHRFDCRSKR